MTSFEYFRGRCERTKYFYCQIVLKDCTLHFIENDLPKLRSVSEEDILYFIAVWKIFEIRKNGKIKSRTSYERISSRSVETDWCSDDGDLKFAPYNTYCVDRFTARCFGLDALYNLHGKVDVKILDAYIPKLYESYVLRKKIPKGFRQMWETTITYWEGWKCERNLFLALSPENKALYEKVDNLIDDFDWIIFREAAPSGDAGWWAIVWNTIQIVRNGGDEDGVYKHLLPHAGIMGDEMRPELAGSEILLSKIEIRDKKRAEVAAKIVKLIKEA